MGKEKKTPIKKKKAEVKIYEPNLKIIEVSRN